MLALFVSCGDELHDTSFLILRVGFEFGAMSACIRRPVQDDATGRVETGSRKARGNPSTVERSVRLAVRFRVSEGQAVRSHMSHTETLDRELVFKN